MDNKEKIIAGAKTFAWSFRRDNLLNVFNRALDLILSPSNIWNTVASEQRSVTSLFLEYVSVLAGLAALCRGIGMMVFGVLQRDGTIYSPRLLDCIMVGSYTIGISVALCYILGFALVSLGSRFGCELSLNVLITLIVYSLTPVWFGYALSAVPQLSIFGAMIAAYSLAIFIRGIPFAASTIAPEFRIRFIGLSCLLFTGCVILSYFILQGMSPQPPG
jgi:hypothetical protein